ncbi:MAG: mechanosensitive ion channel family protein [Vallitaleaceae bacterium]|jgi:small-conductance mechanosensitive channel|nr:mechanosensitive ion channel family protein [Vallitaleaceae bacterium]
MQDFIDFLNTNDLYRKLFWSLLCLIGTIISVQIINRILYKSIKDNKKYYTVKKRVNYALSFVLIIIIIFIWADATSNLTTYIGLLSAGIAISLRELFTNVAAWVFISFKRPFDVGHRVLIGDQRGDVIDIRIFQFSLIEVSSYEEGEQSTGRIIDVPNHFVFSYPLVNYTKGFEYIWNEIKVLITFESDWELAKKLLTEIVNKDSKHLIKEAKGQVREAAKKYMIHYDKLTPIVYTDVKTSGVQLTLRYLCSPKQRRGTVNMMWEDILKMLDENTTIDLAYDTRRVIN